jgi:hypothetical protein
MRRSYRFLTRHELAKPRAKLQPQDKREAETKVGLSFAS